MNTENIFSEQNYSKEYNYITYPRNFASYRWAKPILVFILFLIIYLVGGVVLVLFLDRTGASPVSSLGLSGYDSMNVSSVSGVLTNLGSVAWMLPALALAVFIAKERPFSSYSSARGGWSFKIFFLSMLVAVIIYAVHSVIRFFMGDLQPFDNQFTLAGFIVLTLIGPIQCVAEEYVFRGFVLQTIGSWTRLPVFAVIIQVAVFIALHPYNLAGRISVGFSALIFALCAWAGRGLEVSSGLHIVNNMFAFYMTGFGIDRIKSAVTTKELASSMILDVIFLVIMLIIIKKCRWFGEQKKDDITAFDAKMAARAEARKGGRGRIH